MGDGSDWSPFSGLADCTLGRSNSHDSNSPGYEIRRGKAMFVHRTRELRFLENRFDSAETEGIALVDLESLAGNGTT